MKLLLDTHALAWWVFGDERIPASVRALIAEPSNTVFVSVVSAFECATKHRIGKWPQAAVLVRSFVEIVTREDFQLLDVSVHHALRAGALRAEHRDPFDRLLAAQAEVDNLGFITADPKFGQFNTTTIW